MSSNVGLSTPRGSGTSGYVQRNLSQLNPNKRPTNRFAPYPQNRTDLEHQRHKQRQPDQKILAHDRAREVEVQVFDLRDKLEDQEVEEEEIERQCDELRAKLLKDGTGRDAGRDGRVLKRHQVHELAAAKIEESEKLRKALGIRADYEEGSHWKRSDADVTEDRLRRSLKEETTSAAEKGGGGVKNEKKPVSDDSDESEEDSD